MGGDWDGGGGIGGGERQLAGADNMPVAFDFSSQGSGYLGRSMGRWQGMQGMQGQGSFTGLTGSSKVGGPTRILLRPHDAIHVDRALEQHQHELSQKLRGMGSMRGGMGMGMGGEGMGMDANGVLYSSSSTATTSSDWNETDECVQGGQLQAYLETQSRRRNKISFGVGAVAGDAGAGGIGGIVGVAAGTGGPESLGAALGVLGGPLPSLGEGVGFGTDGDSDNDSEDSIGPGTGTGAAARPLFGDDASEDYGQGLGQRLGQARAKPGPLPSLQQLSLKVQSRRKVSYKEAMGVPS
jgi:hypothetical protein